MQKYNFQWKYVYCIYATEDNKKSAKFYHSVARTRTPPLVQNISILVGLGCARLLRSLTRKMGRCAPRPPPFAAPFFIPCFLLYIVLFHTKRLHGSKQRADFSEFVQATYYYLSLQVFNMNRLVSIGHAMRPFLSYPYPLIQIIFLWPHFRPEYRANKVVPNVQV